MSWLRAAEDQGWACGACHAVAFGEATHFCSRCGMEQAKDYAYRVALTICQIDPRECSQEHQLAGGHRVHVRIG